MINISKVMLLRGQISQLRKEVEADDEWSDPHHLHELADAAEDLTLAIRDRIGDSADAYANTSQGGP
jgi:hypothetical protein